MFDPRFDDLEDPFKRFEGQSAAHFVKEKHNKQWQDKRGLGGKNFQAKA